MVGYCMPLRASGVCMCVCVFVLCVLAVAVVGLVDELVVDNDPEYQWMDNFRQARTSNESRQSLLFKLDATVRRQLGKKVGSLPLWRGCVAAVAPPPPFCSASAMPLSPSTHDAKLLYAPLPIVAMTRL